MRPAAQARNRFVAVAIHIALAATVGIAGGGCSLLSEYRVVDRDALRNPDGHVVGQRETLRYRGTGEVVTRIALYTPWRDADGRIVGYEERTRSGAVIRDLHGNVIGARWKDLRSRGTNPLSDGIAVVLVQPAGRRGAESNVPNVALIDFVRLAERL
ncbi:MAG: hypothetical protein N2653_14260 [Burkholderiales bacterium]|nr:hypothetical protein [Burkholderiales bacterium]